MMRGVLVALGLVVAACGAQTTTPLPTPVDTGLLTQARIWSAASTLTCAEWNVLRSADQSARAFEMLVTIRGFDGARVPPAASLAEPFRDDIVALCSAGSDCANPDVFCDRDHAAEAAFAAYVSGGRRYRP